MRNTKMIVFALLASGLFLGVGASTQIGLR